MSPAKGGGELGNIVISGAKQTCKSFFISLASLTQ